MALGIKSCVTGVSCLSDLIWLCSKCGLNGLADKMNPMYVECWKTGWGNRMDCQPIHKGKYYFISDRHLAIISFDVESHVTLLTLRGPDNSLLESNYGIITISRMNTKCLR